ncbi:MAG: hypothetical protein EOP51_28945 [Sphingobacteriales bacterium]|nr:MAG: hypothetical protein EOP51_28945 [Sphingobacteriales bacterium]
MVVNAYDIAYKAVYNGTGYVVTLYFLEVTTPNYLIAPAPVAVTVYGSVDIYTGSVTIPQGQSSYLLGTFPSIAGGITAVGPNSINGIPVYYQQPPGW